MPLQNASPCLNKAGGSCRRHTYNFAFRETECNFLSSGQLTCFRLDTMFSARSAIFPNCPYGLAIQMVLKSDASLQAPSVAASMFVLFPASRFSDCPCFFHQRRHPNGVDSIFWEMLCIHTLSSPRSFQKTSLKMELGGAEFLAHSRSRKHAISCAHGWSGSRQYMIGSLQQQTQARLT